MGDTFRDPVDHRQTTTDPHAGETMKETARLPALILLAAGVVAFVICLANFALGQMGIGIAALVVAILSGGGGSAWFATHRRGVREAERQWLLNRRGPTQ